MSGDVDCERKFERREGKQESEAIGVFVEITLECNYIQFVNPVKMS